MKKKTLAVILAAFVAIFIISFPYLKAEYLTARYGSQFEGLYEQTHMLVYADYCNMTVHMPDAFILKKACALMSWSLNYITAAGR